jgi:hypothetical protein
MMPNDRYIEVPKISVHHYGKWLSDTSLNLQSSQCNIKVELKSKWKKWIKS